jgi:hypothetical protein
MKFRRRQFLYLAAGAAALPSVSRIARAQTCSGSWGWLRITAAQPNQNFGKPKTAVNPSSEPWRVAPVD